MYDDPAASQLGDRAGAYDAGQRCAKLTSQHRSLLTAPCLPIRQNISEVVSVSLLEKEQQTAGCQSEDPKRGFDSEDQSRGSLQREEHAGVTRELPSSQPLALSDDRAGQLRPSPTTATGQSDPRGRFDRPGLLKPGKKGKRAEKRGKRPKSTEAVAVLQPSLGAPVLEAQAAPPGSGQGGFGAPGRRRGAASAGARAELARGRRREGRGSSAGGGRRAAAGQGSEQHGGTGLGGGPVGPSRSPGLGRRPGASDPLL